MASSYDVRVVPDYYYILFPYLAFLCVDELFNFIIHGINELVLHTKDDNPFEILWIILHVSFPMVYDFPPPVAISHTCSPKVVYPSNMCSTNSANSCFGDG